VTARPTDESPAAERAARRAVERAERREALILSAIDVVRRDGPLVSMDQIAAECGITKPIIYRHFGDREGLLLEMALRFVDQLVTGLLPLASDAGPSRDLLAATMDAYLALVERDANLYRFLSDHAGADRRDLLAGLIAEQISVVLEQRLERAGLPLDPARPWAYGLVGMVHFAGDWWSAEKPIGRPALVEHLMTLAWDGLGSLDIDDRIRPTPDRTRSDLTASDPIQPDPHPPHPVRTQ
jgi:AcrR family transcriptional regulator